MNIIPIKASRILEELFPDGQKSYETNESQQHWTNGQLPWKYFLGKIFVYSLLTEKRNSTQRFRTRFNGEQLGALRDVFERTRYPHWFLIRTLASTIHLDASVIKVGT